MNFNNYKFIFFGLIIGVLYSIGVTRLHNYYIINNPKFTITFVENVIDDRSNLEPNNAIKYNDEEMIYKDNTTEYIHKIYKDHLFGLCIFIFILYLFIDIIFYPEGRKDQSLLRFFQLKKMSNLRRMYIREKINYFLLGLLLSVIPSIIIIRII
jgi:Fe2+ transport system protein B